MEWNASQYLKFEEQRNLPIQDLLRRIQGLNPQSIVDLGCGPGNSTSYLRKTFPAALLEGIDTSESMIQRAKAAYPEISFSFCDARNLEGTFDLIFSNACLQWIPDHDKLLPDLFLHLNPGGVFAAQFPMNENEPLFRIIQEVAADPKWEYSDEPVPYNGTLSPANYYDIFTSISSGFQIWEIKYYHSVEDHRALIDWVKGSRIRPYLARLNEEQQALFEEEILHRTEQAYPVQKNGDVILCFNRFFAVAEK